jgi:hypothetical protein
MQNSDFEGMRPAEKNVAMFLDELGLKWFFEAPVFLYDNEGRPKVWTPGFYLPTLGMHVEVWDSEDESLEYREKAYKKNGYHVIFLHVSKEETEWKNFLLSRITSIELKRHSEVMIMLLDKSLK